MHDYEVALILPDNNAVNPTRWWDPYVSAFDLELGDEITITALERTHAEHPVALVARVTVIDGRTITVVPVNQG